MRGGREECVNLTQVMGFLEDLRPMFQPHLRRVLTTDGNIAAAKGTRMKIKDLWTAYARASKVQIPIRTKLVNIHSHFIS
jgi:hypothetical protein